MSDTRPDLSALISAIRSELERADLATRAGQKEPLFQLAGLELELNFTVTTTDAVKGGFDLKVVSLGSQMAARSEEVQKVRVKFDVPRTSIAASVVGTRFSDEEGRAGKPRSVKPLK